MAAQYAAPPISRAMFVGVMIVTLILGFVFIRRAYTNPAASVIVLWLLSFGMTNVWQYVFHHRWVAAPSMQYPSFWWGDLVFLPLLVALPLSLLMRNLPDRERPLWFEAGWSGWAWTALAIGIALLVSWGFAKTQAAGFPPEVLGSAPKMWHDRVVYPLFVYFLISAAPAIWHSEWGLEPVFRNGLHWRVTALLVLLPVCGLTAWMYAGAVRDRLRDVKSPDGVVRVDADRGYDWRTGEVSDRLVLTTDPENGAIRWVLPATWHKSTR